MNTIYNVGRFSRNVSNKRIYYTKCYYNDDKNKNVNGNEIQFGEMTIVITTAMEWIYIYNI